MAKITKLTKKVNPRFKEHTDTYAEYFFTPEGYLQINTFGSDDRQYEKESQTIQFTPEIMERLIEIWNSRRR